MHRQALLVALMLSAVAGTAQGQERATQEADSLQADSIQVTAESASLLRRPLAPWLVRPPRIQIVTTKPPGDLSPDFPTFDREPSFFDAVSSALVMEMACGEDKHCRSDMERGFERSHGSMPFGANLLGSLLADFVGKEDLLHNSYARQRWQNWPQ